MNETFIYIFLTALVFIVLGWFLGGLLTKNKFSVMVTALQTKNESLTNDLIKNQAETSQLLTQIQSEKDKKEEILIALTQKNTELTHLTTKLTEQKNEVELLQEKFTKDFENLANKILEEKSNKFTEQNRENLKQILNPLSEKIQHFEQKVEQTHKESIDYHAALRQQILGLRELNQQMSKETLNLTKALKGDSKAQGNWGELVLERVLEKSGLEKGREYEVQKSFETDNDTKQRLRPDVIINLPDGKKMIIDAKVSLTHYEQYIAADDDTERDLLLKQHVQSLTRHVEQLSNKRYEDLYQMESPDFVLLFVPIEPAFAVAINADNSLYNKAFERNIVIVTPATLLATLKTVDSMWNNAKQQQNAIEIARQAGALYDKFAGLIEDLMQVGRRMDDAKKEYGNAMNKLFEGKGNLIRRVEDLKLMGAKTQKSLPDTILKKANDYTNEE